MKKISILFSTLLVAGTAFAQQKTSALANQESAKRPATAFEINQSRDLAVQSQTNVRPSRGAEFFCEDFANGFDGNNPLGEWTVEDSGGNTIWMMADATSPNGEFSGGLGAMASPSAANGWVIFDCDLFNTPIADGVEDVTGFLTAPEMDMSGLTSVIVEYNQYFRYCCFGASPLTLEVSINDGADWVVFPAHGDFVQSANSASPNPHLTTVDISCVAAGEESVLIRWAYNSAVADGYSHYFWGLDDICVFENPAVNDLEISQVTNGDIFNIWEYRVTPLEQAVTSADGGLLAGVIFKNVGKSEQTNVEVVVEILDANLNVLSTTIEGPFDIVGNADALECPTFMDSLYIETGWEATAIGTYYVRASISSDATDETPENNTMDREIEFTTDEYGHDGPEDFDLEIRPTESTTPNEFNQTGYGSFLTFPNEGSTAYGLTAAFGTNSDAEVEFLAALFQVVETLDEDDMISSAAYEMSETWDNGDPYYLPFEDEVEMLTEETYFVGVMTDDATAGELTILANANTDNDNSTANMDLNDQGESTWFGGQTWTPGIRLILSEWVGVDEINPASGLTSFQVNPNPASNIANLNFELNVNSVVAYEVRDMSGKLVAFNNIGRMAEGVNNIQINVSDYAAGNYNVSLVLQGKYFVSRQMSVVR